MSGKAIRGIEPDGVEPSVLGWREWVGLPQWDIVAIKAKLDSGARSASLSVEHLETFRSGGCLQVRFGVRPRRRAARVVACTAPVLDRRAVTDSGGHREERWFVQATIVVAGRRLVIETNLTDRRAMMFPLLLGRSALAGCFCIDPALSYTLARPSRPHSTDVVPA
jgi:hypothetical protein